MYKIGLCVAACSSDAACVDLSRGRKPSCLQSEETTWIPSLILLLVGFHSCDMSKCEEIQACLCRKDEHVLLSLFISLSDGPACLLI